MNETQSSANTAPNWRETLSLKISDIKNEWMTAQDHIEDERWGDAKYFLDRSIVKINELNEFITTKN